MRTQDPRQELQDGFELAPVGPDGVPDTGPVRDLGPPRPRLCELGPCRNYHRLEVHLDAQSPGAIRVPVEVPAGTPGAVGVAGGTLYAPVPDVHVQVHHYCYPSPGIEMPLGHLPVVQCNRWCPTMDHVEAEARAQFMASDEAARYRAKVVAWEERQDEAHAQDRELLQLLAESKASPTSKETP